MKIHIGSDHAGLEFKNKIVKHLEAKGHTVVDHGPHTFDDRKVLAEEIAGRK